MGTLCVSEKLTKRYDLRHVRNSTECFFEAVFIDKRMCQDETHPPYNSSVGEGKWNFLTLNMVIKMLKLTS